MKRKQREHHFCEHQIRADARFPRLGCAMAAWLMIVLTLVAPDRALAWGRIGHRAAAKLAESRLTPTARDAVAAILDQNETLADASTWADEVRPNRPESAPWHYVNVPLAEPRYSDHFCPPQGCVVSKIEEFRAILADRTRKLEERREALRFLVHFVEDMHQPLHVGDRGDRGGNDTTVVFLGTPTNLHRVWDSGLIEHESDSEAVWLLRLKALAVPDVATGWERGTAAEWATESLTLARLAFLLPESASRLKSDDKLDERYAAFGASVAQLRLAQAGVRLAWLLNNTLKDD
jgi:hypothetical protein